MAELEIVKCETENNKLTLCVVFSAKKERYHKPRITAVFQSDQEERRMPVPVWFSKSSNTGREEEITQWTGGWIYRIDCLFLRKKKRKMMELEVECTYGEREFRVDRKISLCPESEKEEKRSGLLKWRRKCRVQFFRCAFFLFRLFPVRNRQVAFLSNRRKELGGNLDMVYRALEQEQSWELKCWLCDREVSKMSPCHLLLLAYLTACSSVILVDDYVGLLYQIPRRKHTTMIQLWHACGAFKIFGFSRLGKKKGFRQESMAHRIYDYAIVSSSEIKNYYAEGFGMDPGKIIVTGIPRTDCFWDLSFQKKKREDFFLKYPSWKGKKILLFAPTFRGNGKEKGYYPKEGCDPGQLLCALKEKGETDWGIIVKYHPFIHRSFAQEEWGQWKNEILDLSQEAEINDYLPAADVIVTDYSSLIFEAAILQIPMLFYAFDLEEYEKERGFYYDYEEFVPGKIVTKFSDLVEAIQKRDFEEQKIEGFRKRFFDHWDGKSTQRVVQLIHQIKTEWK